MDKCSCLIGCPSIKNLYTFPSKETEGESKSTFDFQVLTLSSVSYSMYTQTNSRLCGSVEVSPFLAEYRLNCYYCSNTFPIDKYLEFIDHLQVKHFEDEQAFQVENYPYDEHDYTTPYSGSLLSECKVYNTVKDIETQELSGVLSLDIPALQNEPDKFEFNIQDKPLDIKEATKLIKLLDETLLNPNYVYTEKDPLAIDNKDAIKTSNILTTTLPTSPENSNVKASSTTSSFPSNKICLDKTPINSRTNLSSTNIVTIRSTPMRVKSFLNKTTGETKVVHLRTSPSVSLDDVVSENMNSKQFEILNLKKPSKEVTWGLFYIKDIESNTVTQKQTSASSALSKCLKIANTETNDEVSALKIKELVFQFTPREIILDFLDNIKDYPILWTFHNEPNNAEYFTTIEILCKQINEKWFLNLSPVQMRRSINRILTYYRYMLPCDKVDIFKDYFEKCLEFLPSLQNDIPHKRCEYCDICYENASQMRKHLMEKHQYSKLPYKCENCWERFKDKDESELHMHLPHYTEIFRCKHCNKTFNIRQVLKRHLRIHEPLPQERPPKVHECQVCGKGFKTSSELSSHKTYHEEKLFKCHLCIKSYYRRIDLKLHLKSHFNQRDYICEVCGKAFFEQSQLIAHSDIHTGKKVTCNICSLRLRKVSLPRHLRLCHVVREGTIESTFRAKAYNYKKYTSISTSSTSQPKRTKIARQYNCKKCYLNFDRLKFLIDHNNEVHFNVNRIECLICNIQVKHKPSLKRHYRDKHKLHPIQIFKLIDENVDLDTVLSMKIDALPQQEIENNTHLFRFTRADVVDGIDDDDVDNIDDLYNITGP